MNTGNEEVYRHVETLELIYLNGAGYFLIDHHGKALAKDRLTSLTSSLNKAMKKTRSSDVTYIVTRHDEELEKIRKRILRERETELNQNKTKTYEKVNGYVYFLMSETGIFKIGKTKNIESRIKTLKPGFPFKVSLYTSIESENINELEVLAHKHFKDKKVHGEWFDITEEEINKWIGGLTRG